MNPNEIWRQRAIEALARHKADLFAEGEQPARSAPPQPPSDVRNKSDLPTRDETDAKIAAAEARGETKIARMEGKIDLLLSNLNDVHWKIADVRSEYRVTRVNMWVIGFGLAILVLAVSLGMPSLQGLGAQMRDFVRGEGKASLPSAPP
jgi:hypothetical protein